MQFEHRIADCDVSDRESLCRFRDKLVVWHEWLEGDPHHSILTQIHTMMWSDAAYRAFNEARRFATDRQPTAAANGMLCEFLDIGYVATQISSICKVTEESRKVISLRRLFNDIKKQRRLLTRENFVCHDGLPYDPAIAEQQYREHRKREELPEFGWAPNKGPYAYASSERAHLHFDSLSGVAPAARQRGDRVCKTAFSTVDCWFDDPVLKKFRDHRNDFIGHAADRNLPRAESLKWLGFSLGEFAKAQRIVIKIANVLGCEILPDISTTANPVPVAQFDVFENLEHAFIPDAEIERMKEWWDSHATEREGWAREDIDHFRKTIR